MIDLEKMNVHPSGIRHEIVWHYGDIILHKYANAYVYYNVIWLENFFYLKCYTSLARLRDSMEHVFCTYRDAKKALDRFYCEAEKVLSEHHIPSQK